MDISPEIDDDGASWYISHIDILRWMVKLGRVGIVPEVRALTAHMYNPINGCRSAVINIYAWLRNHPAFKLVMVNSYVEYPVTYYVEHDWTEFYGDVIELIPDNTPQAHGISVQIN